MGKIRSLLGLLALGSITIDDPVPKRLIKKALGALVLLITTTVLFVALLLGAIVCLYNYLAPSDADVLRASLYATGAVGIAACISLFAAIRVTKNTMASLGNSFKRSVPLTSHLASEANTFVKSFIEGVLNRPKM